MNGGKLTQSLIAFVPCLQAADALQDSAAVEASDESQLDSTNTPRQGREHQSESNWMPAEEFLTQEEVTLCFSSNTLC